jgi:aminopeptidase N
VRLLPTTGQLFPTIQCQGEVALGDGKKETHFETTPVVSTYITAIVAGPYTKVEDTYVGKKTIPLGIYCRKSLAKHLDPEDIFLLTKQGFAYFEEVFGLAYPFAKYDQLAVAEFNWGAMENAGCVTFAEDVLVFRSKVTERAYVGRANNDPPRNGPHVVW